MKIALGVLIALFIFFGALMLLSGGDRNHPAKDSFFVKWRMINVQKSR